LVDDVLGGTVMLVADRAPEGRPGAAAFGVTRWRWCLGVVVGGLAVVVALGAVVVGTVAIVVVTNEVTGA
jgi:hypothetical protein